MGQSSKFQPIEKNLQKNFAAEKFSRAKIH